MSKSNDPWVSVQLPEVDKAYLEVKAGLLGVTRSECIRRIIRTDAEHKDNTAILKLARERTGSA